MELHLLGHLGTRQGGIIGALAWLGVQNLVFKAEPQPNLGILNQIPRNLALRKNPNFFSRNQPFSPFLWVGPFPFFYFGQGETFHTREVSSGKFYQELVFLTIGIWGAQFRISQRKKLFLTLEEGIFFRGLTKREPSLYGFLSFLS